MLIHPRSIYFDEIIIHVEINGNSYKKTGVSVIIKETWNSRARKDHIQKLVLTNPKLSRKKENGSMASASPIIKSNRL